MAKKAKHEAPKKAPAKKSGSLPQKKGVIDESLGDFEPVIETVEAAEFLFDGFTIFCENDVWTYAEDGDDDSDFTVIEDLANGIKFAETPLLLEKGITKEHFARMKGVAV